MKFIFGQDGDRINEEYKDLLDKNDYYYSQDKKSNIYKVVGFVIRKDVTMVVFPKHYFDCDKVEPCFDDIILLHKVLKKYYYNKTNLLTKYIGEENFYSSNYPFSFFYKVYNYYKRFGLFYEDIKVSKINNSGKIDWKKTIKNSNIIVSNFNIIYHDIYTVNNSRQAIFITDAMRFIIDYTIYNFGYLIDGNPICNRLPDFDFLSNIEYTINQLYAYKSNVFKDIHIDLLDSMIKFFETINTNSFGGKILLKTNYFQSVWQDMVNEYLNKHFVAVNDGGIQFDKLQSRSKVVFGIKTFNFDDSNNKYFINLDHYSIDNNNQYIFDSKYYYDLSELNYKQYAYNTLLDNLVNGCGKDNKIKTYSALLLPGIDNQKEHVHLKKEYGGFFSGDHIIYECYLDIKEVMSNYLIK